MYLNAALQSLISKANNKEFCLLLIVVHCSTCVGRERLSFREKHPFVSSASMATNGLTGLTVLRADN